MLYLLLNKWLGVGNCPFREEGIQRRATETMVVVGDCSEGGRRRTGEDGPIAVFVTSCRGRGVEFIVKFGVFDVKFVGVDADNGACLGQC